MERLDDVVGYGLKIYQNPDWFLFSLDSILLANFINIRHNTNKILDLGTGNGIIPLILSLKTDADILGIDIQSDLINLALKSVEYNDLDSQISFRCCDMKDLILEKNLYNTFDLILSNPPYFTNHNLSLKNNDIHKSIARHELTITLDDIINVTSKLLKEKGVFSMIYRTDRLLEVLANFKKYKVEPKRIKFIYKDINSKSNMVYIEGIKNGKSGLEVLEPFILYNLDGSKSDSYIKICDEVVK